MGKKFISSITLEEGAVEHAVFDPIDVSDLPRSGVVAGGYTSANFTVNQEGLITFAENGAGGGTVTSVATGTGLTGGPVTSTGTISLADTAVTPGSYTSANITVDQQGRITAASDGSGGGTVTSIAAGTGLSGGTITTSGTIALADTAVTPGSYTGANITVDQQGRITAAANGPTSGTVTSITAGTGLSGGTITTSGTVALANTAVTPGSYTSANITVDAQGRITAAADGAGGGTVTSITAGTGLSGGTISTSGTISLANTAVTPGSYTAANITVDAQGRITAAADGGTGGSVTSITAGTGLSGGTITSTGTIALADTAVTPGAYTRTNLTVDAQGRITAASDGTSLAIGDTVGGSPTNTGVLFVNASSKLATDHRMKFSGGTLFLGDSPSSSGTIMMWNPGRGSYDTIQSTAGNLNIDALNLVFAGQMRCSGNAVFQGGLTANGVGTGSLDTVQFEVVGHSPQTHDIMQVISAGGILNARVTKNGYLSIRKNAAPAAGELSNNDLTMWFVATPGATAVKFTGRDSVGNTVNYTLGTGGTATVTSVSMTVPPFLTVSGSPVTSAGTLAIDLATQSANTVFAGPTTGSAAAPTFRSLVSADIPDISATYATRTYVDTAVATLAAKDEVVVATTGILPSTYVYNNGSSGVGATLTAPTNGVLIIDGVTVALGDRVLVKNEAAAANNGIYSVTTLGTLTVKAVLTRTADFNTPVDGINGALVYSLSGTTNANTLWVCTTGATITFGTTAINWSTFTGSTYSADGSTLQLVGTTFSVKTVPLANIANASANSKLLGSGDTGSGSPYVEITLGTGLTMTGTTLAASSSSGGGGPDPITSIYPKFTPAGVDDEFDDGSFTGWTKVDDGTHQATVTETNNVASISFPGSDTTAHLQAWMKSTTVNVGDYIEGSWRMMGQNTNFIIFGLIMADGTTYNSGAQFNCGWSCTESGPVTHTQTGYNTAVSSQAKNVSSFSVIGDIFMRVKYNASNSFQVFLSPDGISWFLLSTVAYTMTPTAVGFFGTTWGGSNAFVASLRYFRKSS